ncbi:MAG: metallophosphoesterase [Oceanicaulis sp.]
MTPDQLLNDATGIDLIGDVHGHLDPLQTLLTRLGYEPLSGIYRHPQGRKVLFLGDLIDRGPANVEVVALVRRMVEHGEAVCLAGNHELNAVHFSMEHPDTKGLHLRPRSDKNLRQHLAFLSQYHTRQDGLDRMQEDIAWFRTLPLWIDLPGLRAVHACWSARHIEALDDATAKRRAQHDAFWHRTATKGDPLRDATDVLLKGAETTLPDGVTFQDKDGHVRTEARIAWWVEHGPWPDRVLGPPDFKLRLAMVQEEPDFGLRYPLDEKPVFFGHYWFSPRHGTPWIAREPNVCCLDFSIARPGGLLTAYRWDDEDRLNSEKLVSVGH